MTISRNVIQDLIPLYLADEVSAESRALVEEHLAADPALAAEVALLKSSSASHTLNGGNIMPLPQDHEVQTLARTRSEISHRGWNFGLAIAFTLFPLSFVFEGGHIQWLLLRNSPSMAMASWAAAVGFWIGFVVHRNRLRGSGL